MTKNIIKILFTLAFLAIGYSVATNEDYNLILKIIISLGCVVSTIVVWKDD